MKQAKHILFWRKPDRTRKQNQDADNEANRNGHHADRQVINKSGAPSESILESVFATRHLWKPH
jgi:hypothetical protein